MPENEPANVQQGPEVSLDPPLIDVEYLTLEWDRGDDDVLVTYPLGDSYLVPVEQCEEFLQVMNVLDPQGVMGYVLNFHKAKVFLETGRIEAPFAGSYIGTKLKLKHVGPGGRVHLETETARKDRFLGMAW